jgi:hypothetical protein
VATTQARVAEVRKVVAGPRRGIKLDIASVLVQPPPVIASFQRMILSPYG